MSKNKFHVNNAGEPGECNATIEPCPFGLSDEEHHSTREEARATYEEKMRKTEVTPVMKKQKKTVQKSWEELKEVWSDEGFKSSNELTSEEYAIADLDLKRANAYLLNENNKAVWPYRDLMSYSPKMKRNNGNWIHSYIRMDYLTGNIYGITTVSKPAKFPSTANATLINVENYGKNIDKAISGTENKAKKTFDKFLNETKAGNKSSYSYKENEINYGKVNRVNIQEENPYGAREKMIKEELLSGTEESREWNRLNSSRSIDEINEDLNNEGYVKVKD